MLLKNLYTVINPTYQFTRNITHRFWIRLSSSWFEWGNIYDAWSIFISWRLNGILFLLSPRNLNFSPFYFHQFFRKLVPCKKLLLALFLSQPFLHLRSHLIPSLIHFQQILLPLRYNLVPTSQFSLELSYQFFS